jgi:hypothetical protein
MLGLLVPGGCRTDGSAVNAGLTLAVAGRKGGEREWLAVLPPADTDRQQPGVPAGGARPPSSRPPSVSYCGRSAASSSCQPTTAMIRK